MTGVISIAPCYVLQITTYNTDFLYYTYAVQQLKKKGH